MRTRASGMTLIEVLISFLIVGVLLGLGVPSFTAWLQNVQVRNAAESIFNGLQLARANAVQRNKAVSFTMPGPDSSWSVNVVAPSAFEPGVIQSRSAAEGTLNAVVTTTNATITFDGLGKTNLAAAANIQVTNPTGGTCQVSSSSGRMRCLNVTVSVGGQVKMCDPYPLLVAGDSRKC